MTKEELIFYLEDLISISWDGWTAQDMAESLEAIVKEIKEKGIK